MSDKRKLPNGGYRETWWAVFKDDAQLTAWQRNKQKTLSALRRSGYGRKGLTLRGQVFVTPPPLKPEVPSET